MMLQENQNIKNLKNDFDFLKETMVVRSGLEEFKNALASTIFNAQPLVSSDFFDDRPTGRAKISFKDFLQQPLVMNVIKEIYRIDSSMRDITTHFLALIDGIVLSRPNMDKVLKENCGLRLKKEMLDKVLSLHELNTSHSYLASRLDETMRDQLITGNADFHESIHTLLDELYSILNN